MLKVIFATGSKEIDKSASEMLSDQSDRYEISECYYREGIDAQEGDVVVLSELLSGQIKMADLIKELRLKDVRVVLLAGNKDNYESLILAKKMISLGAYDIIWNPLTVNKVVERIKKPAKISEVGKEIIVEQTDNDTDTDTVKIVPEDKDKNTGFLRGLFARQRNTSDNEDMLEYEEQEDAEDTSDKIVNNIIDQETNNNGVDNESRYKYPDDFTGKLTNENNTVIPYSFDLSKDVVCVRMEDIPDATRYIKENREMLMIVLDANKGLLASEFVKLNQETDWRRAEFAKPEMYENVEFYGLESDRRIPLEKTDINILLRFTEAALDSGRKVIISIDSEDPMAGEIYEKTRDLRLGLMSEITPVTVPAEEIDTNSVVAPAKKRRLKSITDGIKHKKNKLIPLAAKKNEAPTRIAPVQETVVYKPVDESNFMVISRALGIVLTVLVSLVLTGAVLYLLHIAFTVIGIESPFLDAVGKFIKDFVVSLF